MMKASGSMSASMARKPTSTRRARRRSAPRRRWRRCRLSSRSHLRSRRLREKPISLAHGCDVNILFCSRGRVCDNRNVPSQDTDPAQRIGLYDPSFEHDACGVGFVVDIAGRRSHSVIARGLEVLINLQTRGACGCEANTGDGAGSLIQIPDRFLRKVLAGTGIELPPPGHYAAGTVFLPDDHAARARLRQLIERVVVEEGQIFLGWRYVPVEDAHLGPSAIASRPVIQQIFIGASAAAAAA